MSDLKRLEEAMVLTEHLRDDAIVKLRLAARAYRDLLANGQRVEPDYEAAYRAAKNTSVNWTPYVSKRDVRRIVVAAIGDKLLIDPPTEEE